ncbi:efflux RND transporter periplasmic adaptor subunit [Stieleria sp. JC731]|uniref:efflux RND transporter periplasmic adaptor subunit n=1 Tax=Pirellulaceae TaxID=2691357 RepID=UPI001E56FB61|nr:efflux RND transporter periplasmic adaptor subunit [Stieleria sp. JC731]MCC9603141.1 efflux RND transporter periplasmic adaptor subunit [Stieleria sp. JC731]
MKTRLTQNYGVFTSMIGAHVCKRAKRYGSVLIAGTLIACATPGFVDEANSQTGEFNSVSRGPSTYRSPSLSLEYEGFTEPRFDLMLAATEIGRLESVMVEIGDVVEKGQVIAQLEDGLQNEAVATAQWRAQMHGETDAANAETKLKELRLEQLRSLDQQAMARPDELKRAIADWEIAKARQLAASEQDQLRQLELSRYQLQLDRRKIKAPMAGIVAEIYHGPGEYITPADPAVVRLVVMNELLGVFNIPVEEIDLVNVNDIVSVHLMSASESINGTVESIAPDIDGESGTIEVRVLLDNSSGKFRAGDRCQMKPMKRSAKRTPFRPQIQIGRYPGAADSPATRGGNQVR